MVSLGNAERRSEKHSTITNSSRDLASIWDDVQYILENMRDGFELPKLVWKNGQQG